MSRFEDLNEYDMIDLINNKDSRNPHKVVQTSVRILEDYMREKTLCNIVHLKISLKDNLDETLRKFMQI